MPAALHAFAIAVRKASAPEPANSRAYGSRSSRAGPPRVQVRAPCCFDVFPGEVEVADVEDATLVAGEQRHDVCV
jgi:hypothetical protein